MLGRYPNKPKPRFPKTALKLRILMLPLMIRAQAVMCLLNCLWVTLLVLPLWGINMLSSLLINTKSLPCGLTYHRKKIWIWKEVEIHYDIHIHDNTYFPGNIVLCWGFLEAGFRPPLSPLVVSVINFVQRALTQFTCLSFVLLVMMNYINTHKDYENGQLDINHFLYCLWVSRSNEGNKMKKSPKMWRSHQEGP